MDFNIYTCIMKTNQKKMNPSDIEYCPIRQTKKPFYLTQVEKHEFSDGKDLIPFVVIVLLLTVLLYLLCM